ncbi:hypothetical protein ACLMJK_008763 [Lecanora helva]
MLTFLIRKPEIPNPSPEDNNENAVGLLFRDNVRTFHGDAGSHVTYLSSRFGDIKLSLSEPNNQDEHTLFAHHIWNSGIQMSEFISNANYEKSLHEDKRWNVEGEKVLELGSGTGIVGITAALSGAAAVTLSDYPSSPVLRNLQHNVDTNINPSTLPKVTIQGHEWGVLTDNFSTTHAGHFTRILCADCLWMDSEHYSLARSIYHFLSPAEDARAWVIAGFHTGRAKIAAFFDICEQVGLRFHTEERLGGTVEGIWERDADGEERRWCRERVDEERNRWMVIAILKRGDSVKVGGGEDGAKVEEKKKKQDDGYWASVFMQKGNRHT